MGYKKTNLKFKGLIRKSVVSTVIHDEVCHKWFVVLDYDGMTRVVISKFQRIVSSESGIPLNNLNNDSVAVNT